MKPVVLSRRLRAVASMVTQDSRVCDVGCDHGFVSIYLVERKISPHVLAMDVREGPLGAAREHVAKRELEAYIETRLSDGLHNYEIGEADSLICAGMGGRLMMRILEENREKTASFRELILQPQSELEQFRAWLWEQGYGITDEKMVEEDGKFYPMMRVVTGRIVPCGMDFQEFEGKECAGTKQRGHTGEDSRELLCKLYCRYGALLLRKGDEVLQAYLKREERIYGEILDRLQEQGLSCEKRRRRFREVEILLEECRMAQRLREGGSYGYDQD